MKKLILVQPQLWLSNSITDSCIFQLACLDIADMADIWPYVTPCAFEVGGSPGLPIHHFADSVRFPKKKFSELYIAPGLS